MQKVAINNIDLRKIMQFIASNRKMMKQTINYAIVLLILLTFFVISFLTNILGALNPSVTESFALNETMAGFLPFSFFIAYGIFSIPTGYLVLKIGEKRMMLIAFVLAFMGAMLFAVLPGFNSFLVSLFTIGAGMAMLQVVINPLLRVAGRDENYAFTSVLAQLVFGLASFASPVLYSWIMVGISAQPASSNIIIVALKHVVPEALSWVSIYWIFAVFSLIMLAIISLVRFPQVKLKAEEKSGSYASYKMLLKNPLTLLYFFGIFAYVGAEQGISFWMSKFLSEYHHFDYQTVGASAVSNFWGLMTIGGVVGLILLRVMDSKWVLRLFSMIAFLSFATAIFSNGMISYYGFIWCGFFLSVMYPIIISLALNSIEYHHGSFAGILLTGIIGGAVVQLVIGFLADMFSLKTGMMFVFVALAYILSISFWSKPIVRNKTVKVKNIFK